MLLVADHSLLPELRDSCHLLEAPFQAQGPVLSGVSVMGHHSKPPGSCTTGATVLRRIWTQAWAGLVPWGGPLQAPLPKAPTGLGAPWPPPAASAPHHRASVSLPLHEDSSAGLRAHLIHDVLISTNYTHKGPVFKLGRVLGPRVDTRVGVTVEPGHQPASPSQHPWRQVLFGHLVDEETARERWDAGPW